MKIFFFLMASLICFNTTVFSELSVTDLEKIRQINAETEARLEKRIAAEVKAQSAETKALGELFRTEIRAQSERFSVEIRAQSERFSAEINGLSKRLEFQGQLMIALIIAFVTAHLGVILYQNNKRRSQQKEMEIAEQEATKKIEVLHQEHAAEMAALRAEYAAEMKVLREKVEALEGNSPIV